jgi:hypothetical protein
MHRIDGPGATVDNRFTEGNPALGILASVVTDDWLNDMQEEVASVILGVAGTSLIKGNQTQLLNAIWAHIDYRFPVGMIAYWSGSIATIPAAYRLCNGSNGTPNLMDRFVVGAGSAYTVGSAGGSLSASTGASGGHTHTMQSAGAHAHNTNSAGLHQHTTDVQGAHAHTLTIDGTTLSISQIPSHNHTNGVQTLLVGPTSGAPGGDFGVFGGNTTASIIATGGGGSHTHGGAAASAGGHAHTTDAQGLHSHATDTQGSHLHVVDAVGTHTHAVTATPPYYALAYVMRVN